MNTHLPWSRILIIVGSLAMLVGTIDPLEGSPLILAGSGLVALGMFLGKRARRTLIYWTGVFILIAVGVGAMFGLSAVGGIGGKIGHSMWWGILILPYPLGWFMAVAGGVARIVSHFKARAPRVHWR
jgi:purine-cytosine permease-like protein